MSHSVLKKGSQGEAVKTLQNDLGKLGYDLKVDGIFGPDTENAVLALQRAFGYTTDGIVGEGTQFLVRQQIGYNWNAKKPATQAATPAAAPNAQQQPVQPPAAQPAAKMSQDPNAKMSK